MVASYGCEFDEAVVVVHILDAAAQVQFMWPLNRFVDRRYHKQT